MSKSVRLKDYLADELERIAERENRSLANLVNTLLEQAIEMDQRAITKVERMGNVEVQVSTTPAAERKLADADSQPRDVERRTIDVPPETGSFKPDFKPERKKK